MSAPFEVWLTDTDEGWVVTSALKGLQRGSPRYLRADMPCSECYHLWQDTEDADNWECDEYGEKRKPQRLGCFAFVPRKEQP